MIITWYGQTCFRLNTLRSRNGSVNILIDPFEKEIGLRPPKTEADILLFSYSSKRILSGNFFLINGPGEYNVKGAYIQGIPSKKGEVSEKTVIYTIEVEKMKICHLGKLEQKELTPDQIGRIGKVDILMVPIGGKETLEAGEAVKVMSQIEPKIIIPMYYQIPRLRVHPVKSREAGISPKAKLFNRVKLDELTKFLKLLGIKSIEPLSKLSIKKKDISGEEAKIIALKP